MIPIRTMAEYIELPRQDLDTDIIKKWAEAYADLTRVREYLGRHASETLEVSMQNTFVPWQQSHAKLRTETKERFKIQTDISEAMNALGAILDIDEAALGS